MIEDLILGNIVYNEEYMRKTIPFIKKEYFDQLEHRVSFELIENFITKYNKNPSKDALLIHLEEKTNLTQDQYNNTKDYIETLKHDNSNDEKWLLDKTEKFCQDKALYNAVYQAADILGDDHKARERGNIPKMIQDALGIMFETRLGHDYILDSDRRFDYYHDQEERLPLGLKYFDLITKGGLYNKSLNILSGGTGTGKSLYMCHFASYHFLTGKNVLYLTLEMSEEMVGERIDANLLNIPIDELQKLPKEEYDRRINQVKSKSTGKIIIHEYPTASAGASHFRYLINELRLKKNFIPDIIYVDYLNICSSSRFKGGNSSDSYGYLKSVSEELRGLAIEFDVPLMTGIQVNRKGFKDTNMDLDDISDSFGISFVADLVLGIIAMEELTERGQMLIKQLKNRRGDKSRYNKFVIGVDHSRMKLYDVEDSEQSGLEHVGNDGGPEFDKTAFGKANDKASKAKNFFS